MKEESFQPMVLLINNVLHGMVGQNDCQYNDFLFAFVAGYVDKLTEYKNLIRQTRISSL